MAPQVKRNAQDAKSAQSAKSGTNKRAKAADSTMQAVVDALDAAEDVPTPCRQMLLAMLPGSLAMPADCRSEEQDRVVAMVKQVLDGLQEAMVKTLADKDSCVEELTAKKAELAQKATEAAEAAAASVETTAAKKTALKEAEEVLKAATTTHSEARERQSTGDAPLLELEVELESIRKAMEGPLSSLCDAEKWTSSEVTAWCDAVAEALKQCRVAESMLISVRASCAVAPSERGDFERMVVAQLEKTCTERTARLTGSLEEGAEARAQRKAAVDDAREKEEAAEAVRTSASEAVLDAEVEESNCSQAQRLAKEASAESCSALEAAAAQRDQASAALESFRSQSVAGFESLETKKQQQEAATTAGGA